MTGYGRRGVVGMGVLGGVALMLSSCAVLVGSGRRRAGPTTQAPNDRFAEFTEYVPEKLEIRTDVGPLNRRMPGISVSSAHWVTQYRQEEREVLPPQDRPIWTHAVMGLEPVSAQALAEASMGTADPLPGIHPDLRQYVSKDEVFTAVPKEKADEILDGEHMIQDDPNIAEPHHFQTDQAVICADSNLLILIATEWHT